MKRNIIFDIGGIFLDDKNRKITEKYGINIDEQKRIMSEISFRECLLGNIRVKDYIEKFRNTEYYEFAKESLSPENYRNSLPPIQEIIDLIPKLEEYNLYLLSNNILESSKYFYGFVPEKYFQGHIFSFEEHLVKPDPEIYELLLDRYNLVAEECIFFDDKKRNTEAAEKLGIESMTVDSPGVILEYFGNKNE
ncbi:MAG: HAD-IA family hydrolase [Candidatus Saccharibacteria bacterium]|nr:HAD-IA family hydrolase [Candidatus Saccharibacteria bacterium]